MILEDANKLSVLQVPPFIERGQLLLALCNLTGKSVVFHLRGEAVRLNGRTADTIVQVRQASTLFVVLESIGVILTRSRAILRPMHFDLELAIRGGRSQAVAALDTTLSLAHCCPLLLLNLSQVCGHRRLDRIVGLV